MLARSRRLLNATHLVNAYRKPTRSLLIGIRNASTGQSGLSSSKVVAAGSAAALLTAGVYYLYPSEPTAAMPHTKKPHKLDTLTPLSREEVEEKLRKFEKTALVGELGAGPAAATWLSYLGMNGGMAASPHKPPVVRFDTNSVNSNDPCEDYYCQHTFNGNLIFSMFDGHGGPECAALLKKYLASYIAHAVSQLPALTQDHLTSPSPNRKKAVESALKSAFKRMDADIVGGAIDVAPNSLPLNSRIKESLKSALAGSCALVAYMEGNDVYVCCTGDSRAVLGSCTSEGRFMATDLSADQTVKNPNEYGRLIDEHPGELETVVVRGRVLGGLMPTRAFGDARYKWPLDIQNKVLPALSRRSTPRNYKTPPYVTAEPEVTHYLIDPSRDKFLVLATDGLYDVLESDDVVSVVSEYMRHKNLVSPPVDKRVDKWLHVDENAATDLLRNALGGPDEERTRKLLAIPAPLSRRFRDDITINVIFFGQNAPTLSSSPSSSTVLASPENIGIGSPSDYGNLASVDLTLALAKRQRLGEWANWLDRLAKL